MKSSEIRLLSAKEIQIKLAEFRKELLSLKLRKQLGQMEKPHLLSHLRRLIARCETALQQSNI
jgi:large subunit ribosomal protein L29